MAYPQSYSNQPQYEEAYTTEPVKSDEVYANVMQEERVKNIIAQTSPDNQLVDIEWRIKGYKKNPFTNMWEKIDPKTPEPPGLLIGRYITYLSSILNDNTRFTNLSSNEINKIMDLIIEWLVDDLDTHADEYGMGNQYTERTRIGQIILNNTFLVLKRSENGMESRRIWGAINMNETMGMQPQKKGFVDAMKAVFK